MISSPRLVIYRDRAAQQIYCKHFCKRLNLSSGKKQFTLTRADSMQNPHHLENEPREVAHAQPSIDTSPHPISSSPNSWQISFPINHQQQSLSVRIPGKGILREIVGG